MTFFSTVKKKNKLCKILFNDKFSRKMFRQAIFSAPVLFAAVPIVNKEPVKETVKSGILKCRPSELPVYGSSLQTTNEHKGHAKQSSLVGAIESGVRTVRVEVFSLSHSLDAQKKSFDDILEDTRAKAQTTYNYLNEPANTMPRVGAIAIGGLAGMIFAIRGGFIKKVLYTGIGAGSIASLCYPKETSHYGQIVLLEAKKNFAIGYNFAMGIKPEDNDKKLPDAVSKFPTSFKDLTNLGSDLINSAKEVVFPNKSK